MLRVNVEIDIVHALLQTGNVTQMSVEIVGLGIAVSYRYVFPIPIITILVITEWN